ncbi:hypothetical protein ACMU_05040 [Actibacterium mucosum KCTC 23349]|uniref:ABM domain-containing protein n=1 Tax=Actibacterium mucosum KCTC 23349 TaxID=1454373 RepID=A0A037ZL18_9RHOB|nr:hypothetical protein [Actibacterium mucosum]KAJ56314.1 hypothetical protein ACMU_05040 [Actibacterium mucosum KCTC 23349]
MITRYAIFEGEISDDQRHNFEAAVLQRLLPAVRKLPGLNSAAVSFARRRDPGAPGIVMFLVTTYPDLASVDVATQAPQRKAAQQVTDAIFAEFATCTIHHHVTETRELRR